MEEDEEFSPPIHEQDTEVPPDDHTDTTQEEGTLQEAHATIERLNARVAELERLNATLNARVLELEALRSQSGSDGREVKPNERHFWFRSIGRKTGG